MKNKRSDKVHSFRIQLKDRILHIEFVDEKGSINIDNIDSFSYLVDDKIKFGVDKIKIDCTNLYYIDTSGLGKLVAYTSNIELIMTNVNSKVKKILDMTNLSSFFTIR
ncbi:MAG: STAS domain-containing protein [Spirochaetes bacterium]|nr:STAS domain-containing protein [Spirochaetota bacterium]